MSFVALSRPWAAPLAQQLSACAGRLLVGLLQMTLLAGAAVAEPAAGPTVKEVVEFTRLVQPRDSDETALQSQVSPDGRQAFIVTRTADVAAGRNRFRVVLLDLAPAHLNAGTAEAPRTLLTLTESQDPSWMDPAIKEVRWADARTLVFRARMNGGVDQAYRVDVPSGQLKALTRAATPVVAFATSANFQQTVYVAQIPKPPLAPGARDIVVASQSFWSVKFGQDNLIAQDRQYQYFVTVGNGRDAARPIGPVFAERSAGPPGVSLSPDGRWALLPRYELDRQLEWQAQYPLIAQMKSIGASLNMDPLGYFSRPRTFVVRTLVAHRLADGHEQVVVDAPDDAWPSTAQARSDRLWQDGGRSVVIAGTHLPASANRGNQSHIIEYWPDSARVEVIASLEGRMMQAYALPGPRAAFVVMDGAHRRIFERAQDGGWLESTAEPATTPAAARDAGNWSLRLEQALNVPPDVWAVSSSGQRVRLTQLNLAYDATSWGTASAYSWSDGHGRRWDGGLLLPSGNASPGPHPLVIQTYGFSPERFYLDGTNIGDGATSGFAGRAFLREGLIVLALPATSTTDKPNDDRGMIDTFADGVRGAIDALVAQGLVDPDRVGLMGWSATGERTLNLVTFTDIPIRAASVLDGDANTMFSLAITYAFADSIQARKEATNGGLPYSPTLAGWVAKDPSLHTDCVRSALRIETYGPAVLNNWDVYALLRRQYKPAEMIVLPGGSHSLSNPSDRMVSLQGNVDWYRFWLQDKERQEPVLAGETEESLRTQYVRWRQMAGLRTADALKPRCDRS